MPTALWVIPVSDLGGVARHVSDVTRVGIPGYKVVVLCPRGPLAAQLEAQGVTVMTGDFGPQAGLLSSRRTLAAAVHKFSPEIVHSHLAYADIVSSLVSFPATSIRISTEHGIAGDDSLYHSSRLKAWSMKKVHRLRLTRFRGVIAVSLATKTTMIEKWNTRTEIVVVYNGVDIPSARSFSSRNSKPNISVLSLSRLAPEKRIDKLIEAFEILHTLHPTSRLTIAGEGPEQENLRSEVYSRNLQEWVNFPGFLDSQAALSQSTVLAQLSTWENCSYTLLDAQVARVGIVASPVGGNKEILARGQLVDPDNPTAVAHALIREHNSDRKLSLSPVSVEEMTQQISQHYSRWSGASSD